MDLFLFQNAEEIESAKKIKGEPLEKFHIIACSPFAVDGLKKQSIDFYKKNVGFKKKMK